MNVALSTNDGVNPAPTGLAPATHAPPARRWLLPTLGVLAVLLLGGAGVLFRDPLLSLVSKSESNITAPPADPVTVAGKDLIAIDQTSPLKNRLRIESVVREDLEYPLLTVTGYVMARLSPGSDLAESRWDFASPDVATAYADWRHATADEKVLKKQADKTRELVKVRVDFLFNEFKRKEKLYPNIPERDVVAAKADHLQAEIQGEKDKTDADAGFKKAERSRGLLQRQLEQAGVDPNVVSKATPGLVLVVADVPEGKISKMKEGLPCKASFFGVPGEVFEGKVGRLGPSVNKEKRTLRVTFELTDKSGCLLPGMFADIGLDAKKRSVLTVPTAAVLHAGNSDYVLKEEAPGRYRVVKVKVDEPRMVPRGTASVSCTPVLEGALTKDERVVGAGAILLKPIMAKALAQ